MAATTQPRQQRPQQRGCWQAQATRERQKARPPLVADTQRGPAEADATPEVRRHSAAEYASCGGAAYDSEPAIFVSSMPQAQVQAHPSQPILRDFGRVSNADPAAAAVGAALAAVTAADIEC